MNPPRLSVIACRVFERELEVLRKDAPTDLSVQFIEIGLHEKPGEQLRAALQLAVDAVPADKFDAVALAYGLCNRGIVGLKARGLPLVIPRAHDCLGILLGSSKRYLAELDKQPGTYFQSAGWIEHLPPDRSLRPLAGAQSGVFSADEEKLIAQYGEENARFLMEEFAKLRRHYERLVYIATPIANAAERERQAGEMARKQGWAFERLPGDLGWLKRLTAGEWSAEEFLVLKPGQRVARSYDERSICAEPP